LKEKKSQNRVEIPEFSGIAFQFFRIAEKLLDLHFPGTNPISVHCFWNNSEKDEQSFKFDAHFRRFSRAKDEFVVEVLLVDPKDKIVEVRWSETPDHSFYKNLQYGDMAGETRVMLN
jgi:hypothetical protein